ACLQGRHNAPISRLTAGASFPARAGALPSRVDAAISRSINRNDATGAQANRLTARPRQIQPAVRCLNTSSAGNSWDRDDRHRAENRNGGADNSNNHNKDNNRGSVDNSRSGGSADSSRNNSAGNKWPAARAGFPLESP